MLRALRYSSGLGMPLPQQQLAFVPVQLCLQRAFPGPFDDLQRIVQQGHALFNLPPDLPCPGQETGIVWHPHLQPGGAVSRRTAAQDRYPLCHIAILDLDPPVIDRPLRTPVRETLLSRDRNQLVRPPIQGYVISDQRKQDAVEYHGSPLIAGRSSFR
jgi:hypothetical protein